VSAGPGVTRYAIAMQLDAEDASTYCNRGIVWHNKGEHDKAIRDFTEAIQLDPKYTNAYHNRGVAWLKVGKYDMSIKDYTEAIRLAPTDVEFVAAIARAYAKSGDYKKAVEWQTKAVDMALESEKSTYWQNLDLYRLGEDRAERNERERATRNVVSVVFALLLWGGASLVRLSG
jgi:tetratricopeptide (TPR) repeat protein